MAGTEQAAGTSGLLEQVAGLLSLSERAASAYGRDDLLARLQVTRRRLNQPSIRVLVVGEYKQGKSSLVNALVAANVCPVDDDIATSVPTAVGFSPEPVARSLTGGEADGGDPAGHDVPFEQLAQLVSEAGNPENEQRLLRVEVGIPSDLLATGLILEDTPGVGGLASAHSAATLAALPDADAVLFVSDASQEFTGPELEFLGTARARCPNVFCVLTKIDFYPDWRRILELDRGHLAEVGLPLVILPVSTALRFRAINTGNDEVDRESGYPELLGFLRRGVVENGERLAARSAVNDQLSVVAQLEGTFASEREVLADPARAKELIRDLTEARERAGRLKSQAARWQQTLNDGVTDLNGEVDFDLRDRLRRVTQEGEELIDEADPGKTWGELQDWLRRRVGSEVSENYALLADQARDLAERVAEHFASAQEEIDVSLTVRAPDELLGSMDIAAKVEAVRRRVGGSALTVLKGSYSGTSLMSMIGGIAGVAIMSPVTAAVGLLMGRRALRDERQRHLTSRRQQAKAGMRRFIDEVTFRVGKHSRDALRQVQRQLRDQFTSLAEEVQRSSAEALTAGQGALQADQSERQDRLRAVDAELGRIRSLRERLTALAPDLAPAGP